MGIPWDGTGMHCYGMGQINMSHGQPCIFTFANNVLAKFVDTTCIFRDAGAAVGQGEQ